MVETAGSDPVTVQSKKTWATLITNAAYLPGLLALDYSLRKVGSKYPLLALYTESFPKEGHDALDLRKIAKKRVSYVKPESSRDYSNDPRFYDCWSKMAGLSLTEYDRVVTLDSDMFALQNMDELMELHLDPPGMGGTGNRVFAASCACACNPLKKPHYPKHWTPENCAYTTQHGDPDRAQTEGPSTDAGIGMVNGGLQVANPSAETYKLVMDRMNDPSAMANYEFADQSLLSDLFKDRWVPLPYTYNALKTLRWKDVHAPIWRDDMVKNVHLILSPKPWDEKDGQDADVTHTWWKELNRERLDSERQRGIDDGF